MHSAEPPRVAGQSRPRVFDTAIPSPAGSSSRSSCRVRRAGGSPAPAACGEGGDVPGEDAKAQSLPGQAKPGDFWALFHAFPAGAGGSRRGSSGCSQPGAWLQPQRSRPGAIPSVCLSLPSPGCADRSPWAGARLGNPGAGAHGLCQPLGTGGPEGPSPEHPLPGQCRGLRSCLASGTAQGEECPLYQPQVALLSVPLPAAALE